MNWAARISVIVVNVARLVGPSVPSAWNKNGNNERIIFSLNGGVHSIRDF